MLENLYKELKQDYSKYIIIIKSGNFYVTFNKDAIIINDLLNYTLNETKNGIKIGFPITGLKKVIKKIEEKKLNYLIIENNEIVIKKKFNNNKYDIYNNNYYLNLKKINNITLTLKENLKIKYYIRYKEKIKETSIIPLKNFS